jgi:hypothetical protein
LPADWLPVMRQYRHVDSTSTEVTIAPQGAKGKTRYTYTVVEKNAAGKVIGKGTETTLLGNATLGATNYNKVSWTGTAGATKYDVYRNTDGKIATDQTATSFDDKGGAATAGAIPEAPPKHIVVETDADGMATAKLKLSSIGGDVFEPAVYLAEDPILGLKTPLKAKKLTVWRRFWYQMTSADGFNVPDPAAARAAFARVNMEMSPARHLKFVKVADSPARVPPRPIAPAGTFYPAWQLKPGAGTAEQAVIGDHNKATFYAMNIAESDKPTTLKAHLVLCEHQWDTKRDWSGSAWVPSPSPLKTVDIDKSPSDEITLVADAILSPPLQGGDLKVQAEYQEGTTWKPLANGDILVQQTRTAINVVKVQIPTGGPVPTATAKVKVRLSLKRADGPYLGESDGPKIMIVYDSTNVPDYNDSVAHEIGHSYNQVPVFGKQPEGSPDHPNQFAGQGNHCNFGNKKCIMYESGPQSTAIHQFCEKCEPYLMLQDLSQMKRW